MLGYPVDEMLGKHIHDFRDEEGRRIAKVLVESQEAAGKTNS